MRLKIGNLGFPHSHPFQPKIAGPAPWFESETLLGEQGKKKCF